MTNFTQFDAVDYLDSDEAIAEYLNAALEDDDPDVFLMAIGTVARAKKGMADIANESGLGRESLYKSLASGSKPRFDTVLKVMKALGLKLQAEAA